MRTKFLNPKVLNKTTSSKVPYTVIFALQLILLLITCNNSSSSEAPIDNRVRPTATINRTDDVGNTISSTTANAGDTIYLSASDSNANVSGSIIIAYQWQQVNNDASVIVNPTSSSTMITLPRVVRPGGISVTFALTVTSANRTTDTATFQIDVAASLGVDGDGDGLIEIFDLNMLYNMRYNLAGTSYKTSSIDTGDTTGAPTSATENCGAAGLCGYELMNDLDFDGSDEDTTTWTSATDSSGVTTYILDADDNNATYFPTASGGWEPIGDSTLPFTAIFEGNGFAINNLAIRRDQEYLGLFGDLGVPGSNSGNIRNIGLINALVDNTGSSNNSRYIGSLVGQQNSGNIMASYSTGDVNGGEGNDDNVGGLVGSSNSLIIASYSASNVGDGVGNNDKVGGLVGHSTGSVVASYAAGSVDGGNGASTNIGGLVGLLESGGNIVASYATGNVNSGSGANDVVGGLVGLLESSSIIVASYAAGSVNGGSGANDVVGGLVGRLKDSSSIVASYATGSVNGGSGANDVLGRLLAELVGGSVITQSYGFGIRNNGEVDNSSSYGVPPNGVAVASGLIIDNVGNVWNRDIRGTMDAWNFNTRTNERFGGGPTLNFADYDGMRNDYDCSMSGGGTVRIPNCGILLPNQD